MALVVVGALNWGLVGLGNLFGGSDWNVVNYIFTDLLQVTVLENIVYVLVGLSALLVCKGCRSN